MSDDHRTFKAVVDWIELEIQLSKRSNFWTMQEALRKALRLCDDVHPFVESVDKGSGSAATTFRFRIHDPHGVRQIEQVLFELQQRFTFGPPKVNAIEIAFDTYQEDASVHQLAELTANRYKFLTSPPGDDWYFYRNQGDGRQYVPTLVNHRDLVKRFADLWQLTDRNGKDADVRYHAYVKTKDDGLELPPELYRARLEVTLQGAAWSCKTMEELSLFNFTCLAKHFKFRRLAPNLHPAVRHVLEWTKDQQGRSGKYRRANPKALGTYSGTRVFKRSTVADDKLNEAAYQCLRKLTREWRSGRSSADFPTGFDVKTAVCPEHS